MMLWHRSKSECTNVIRSYRVKNGTKSDIRFSDVPAHLADDEVYAGGLITFRHTPCCCCTLFILIERREATTLTNVRVTPL